MKDNPVRLIECTINDNVYAVQSGSTVLQACERSGLMIPRFCFHDRLSIAGNCRMCLVQVDRAVKPAASCALEVLPGMKIFTNTAVVKKAREGVMEFLLANHPLDCPICDQGGECDLQDQALVFGNDRGRFYEIKRAVADKDWGHLIKTVMTRCIHCTRCHRFSSELGGKTEIGMVGRGNKSEITNFLGSAVLSEVSGNVIDLCPVGALTSKPYAFAARPWELSKFEGLDLSDSMCSNIVYNVSGQKILRILPAVNLAINEEWLSNRARFFYDGVRLQRLLVPSFSFENKITVTTCSSQFTTVSSFYLNPFGSVSVSAGELDLESSFFLDKLFSIFSGSQEQQVNCDFRDTFLLKVGYTGISAADLIVLVGTNLKRDLPLLLVRIRYEQNRRNLTVLVFGSFSLGVDALNCGLNTSDLLKFSMGKHKYSTLLRLAQRPLVLTSSILTDSKQFSGLLETVRRLVVFGNDNAYVWSVPVAGSFRSNLLEVGRNYMMFSTINKINSFCLFINADKQYVMLNNGEFKSMYVGAYGSDFLLKGPICVYPVKNSQEVDGYYMNGEGRLQLSRACLTNSKVPSTLQWLLASISFSKATFDLDFLESISVTRNAVYTSSFFISRSPLYSLPVIPFFSPFLSSYQTTPATNTSPLLSKSSALEKKFVLMSFPS